MVIPRRSELDPGRGRPTLEAPRRILGPGDLVGVGYMDPGTWATDIAGGSAFD